MYRKKNLLVISLGCLLLLLLLSACSNKKNTSLSRAYHSVNTRYNSHFNANEAYKEGMKAKEKPDDDNLSQLLYIFPEILDSADLKYKGAFTTTIDKTTKAIKLHSIKTRPKRDPNKRGDVKHQQWIKQKEFNPFLINTWMLLAKAEFEEGNYLRAITTFLYITKIYDQDKRVVCESKLWIARAYSEMGWRYEAENVLRKMEQNDEIHSKLLGMYATVKANIHVRNKNYPSAIPYLEESIKQEKNGYQKRRQKYLLAQLYAEMGEKEKAYKAFGDVRGASAPYHYSINARLRQFEVSHEPQKKVISLLEKMTKGSKNKEYLDQVYTSLGNIYLNNTDTLQAINNYAKAIKESTRSGYDKAQAEIRLGALYFDKKEYVRAQPCYSSALPQLKKNDDNYNLVALRSEVLDQLVVHAKVVQEQDSLLLLANMPENERLDVINKHIAQLKKEEEKKKKKEDLEKRQQELPVGPTGWGDLGGWSNNPSANQAGGSGGFGQQEEADFYFYSEQAVTQGKIAFQKEWGRRPLEDNWRRKNKQTTTFSDEEELVAEEDKESEQALEEGAASLATPAVTDEYSVEYYLQQLPLTDAAKEASYKLVEIGLFNMGMIYKDLLEDKLLAIDTFEEDLSRFPNTPNREKIYYQLFLIYLQMGNDDLMVSYRNKIIIEFPESKYTVPLSDSDYAWNFKYMSKKQEELYQETYQAYLAANVNVVRANYTDIQTKFPFVELMPKFALLNSLTYAQTKDAKKLEQNLTKLIAEYPQSDVTPFATGVLKNIKDGKILLSDGTPIKSMDWTMAYSNDSIFQGDSAKVIEYRADVDKPYVLLLMFKTGAVDRNELLYEVADYNFSNYIIQTYDLNFEGDKFISTLEINGFEDFKTIKSYLNKAMQAEGLLTKLDKEIMPIPISGENYTSIYPRLGLEEYMTFYADSLATATPALMAYWDKENNNLIASIDKVEEVEETLSSNENIEKPIEEDKTPETPVEKQETEEKDNDKEVNLEDVLSKEQVEAIGKINAKADDLVESISNLGSNPVEGLKNLFNRNKLDDNLTKEEKAELKQEQKEEKERLKQLQKIAKAKADSVARVGQFRLDSVKQIENATQDSIRAAERAEKERIGLERKERERQVKEAEADRKQLLLDKENARKEQLREREEQRKQQEKERADKLRQRERDREVLMKNREAERKEKEKAAEELRKEKEREREEQMKRREQESKERRK